MKLFLALVSGFAITLGVFGAGAGLATAYLVGPQQERDGMDATAGWTSEPVRVAYAPDEPQPQDQETALGADVPKLALVATANAVEAAEVATDPERERAAEADALAEAHLDWCHDRYRSYRIEDNTYRPYDGGREFCISPYLQEMEATARPVGDGEIIDAAFQGDSYAFGSTEAPAMDDVLTGEHIRSCFDRYRSYRPQDNSYQPYGGGPRRQCL